MSKICCFIGHRNVKKTANLREKLTDTVRWLITEKEVDKFLFGSKSNFDDFCQEIVKGLKEEYAVIIAYKDEDAIAETWSETVAEIEIFYKDGFSILIYKAY